MSIYTFGNGVQVHLSHLEDHQLDRYNQPGNGNLHEPVEEEWLLRQFSEHTPPYPAFLDVGAGIGYYSILVKKTWPQANVYAAEPLPRHAAAIAANLEVNGLQPSAVKVLPLAVGVRDGSAFLHDAGYGASLADGGSGSGLNVETKTLSSLLRDLPPIHLMKVDIQGLEFDILKKDRALSDRRISNLIIGTHSREIHENLLALLRGARYEVVFEDATPALQPDGIIVARLP